METWTRNRWSHPSINTFKRRTEIQKKIQRRGWRKGAYHGGGETPCILLTKPTSRLAGLHICVHVWMCECVFVCDTLCVCVLVRVRVWTYTHIGVRISIHQVYVVKLHSVGKALEGGELQRFRQRVGNRAEILEVCASVYICMYGPCIRASYCDDVTVSVCLCVDSCIRYCAGCCSLPTSTLLCSRWDSVWSAAIWDRFGKTDGWWCIRVEGWY